MKKYLRRLFVIPILLTNVFLLSFAVQARQELVTNISLITLIAHPIDWNFRLVNVAGVLSLQFEDEALYLDEESYAHIELSNAIYLDIPKDLYLKHKDDQGEYVLVGGRFVVNKNYNAATQSTPAGTIKVTSIHVEPSRQDFEKGNDKEGRQREANLPRQYH